jgi:transposase
MLKTLHVGIDVGHDRHSFCLTNEAGKCLVPARTVLNNRPGAAELIAEVQRAALDYEEVLVGMEATGLYWWHLYRAMSTDLSPATTRVVVFNPRLIHGFRDASNALEKTDVDDAYLIAERLRFGHLPVYPPPDPRYFPLQRLTRYRFTLVHSLVRAKAAALGLVFLAASEYERVEPFSDPFGATSVGVLREFQSLDELAAAPIEDLTAFITHRGRNRFADPSAVARLLQKIAAESFRLDLDAVDPIKFLLSSALAQIQFLTQQIKLLDERIARELERFPNTLLSVPGIGPVYAAGLIAEVGDVARFPDDNALAKYAGLWWPRHQSGDFEASERPLARAGNAYLRYYLCEAVTPLRMHNAVYQRFYEMKFKETPKHAHKRATVLTARKLVRLVYALLKTNQPYSQSNAVSRAKHS